MERRTYRRYSVRGKTRVLVGWIQRRCIRCERFLSLREMKYCSKCRKEIGPERDRTRFLLEGRKEILRKADRDYYQRNKDKFRVKNRKYYEEHKIKDTILF